jgi:hypothetical protein
MLSRRAFVGSIAASIASTALPARASLARGVPLAELVGRSRHIILGTATSGSCQWEKVGRSNRIVTYSVVRVEAALNGEGPASSEVYVRSLGGSIGGIGQIVHGEAMLGLGEPAAVFLADLASGVFQVTAMSQGHYPLYRDDHGVKRLRSGLESLELVGTGAAAHALHGRTVAEAQNLVAAELGRGR